MFQLYTALPVVRMHCVYVSVPIERLYHTASVYLQMNHLSTYGGDSCPFSIA